MSELEAELGGSTIRESLFPVHTYNGRNPTLDEINKTLTNQSTGDDLVSYYSDSKNKEDCPRLVEAIPHFLTAMPTSTPSERLFSIAGWQVDDRRNRLLADITESLMIVYENIDLIRASMRT